MLAVEVFVPLALIFLAAGTVTFVASIAVGVVPVQRPPELIPRAMPILPNDGERRRSARFAD